MVKIPTPKPFGKPKLPIPGLPLQKIGDRINNAADVIKERLENSPLGNLNTPQKDTSELGRLIEAASGSRLSSAPGFRQLRTYLDNEVERDGGESLTKSLRKRAADARGQAAGAILFGQELSRRLQPKSRVVNEVLKPLRDRRIDGATALRKIDGITGINVRNESARRVPGWAVGIGATMEGGMGISGGGAFGVCFDRNLDSFIYVEGGAGLGLTCEAEMSVHVQLAPCPASDMGGLALAFAGGAGYGASGTLEVSFQPSLNRSGSLLDPKIIWQFDGITIQVGAGVGFEASMGISYCHVINRV